jgi:NADPH:quinone reductase-like Zn-dependent oxidoreductase
LFDVLVKDLTIRGYKLAEVTTDPARRERGKQFILEGLADGRLKPIIAKTFSLEEIVEAHRYMESNEQIGKIVVTV